jgi:tRNA(Ile)-lysidine synthase
VLRHWVEALGLPPLPANGVARIESTLLPARPDAAARFEWHGAVIHAWRDLLHAGSVQPALPGDWQAAWDGVEALRLPNSDTLALRRLAGADVALAGGFGRRLLVHGRRGGERITLPGRHHGHALKQVLQDFAVPPWERARLPLLSTTEGELLAAGDRILSARFRHWLRQHDATLQWSPAPLPTLLD